MARRTEFLAPVFRGRRFDGHAMPVEVLPELTEYKRLIEQVAKELYRREHPQRQRLPARFATQLRLEVRTIRQGCAIPVLERVDAPEEDDQGSLLSLGKGDLFERARDLINDTIELASQGRSKPVEFPSSLLGHFERFGRSLLDGEHIEMSVAQGVPGPRYCRKTRRTLLLQKQSSYTEAVTLKGAVIEVSEDKHSFVLNTEGLKISAPAPEEHFEVLMGSLHLHHRLMALVSKGRPEPLPIAGLVQVSGTGRFNGASRLLEMEIVEDVEPIDSEADREILSQMEHIFSLTEEDFARMERPASEEDLAYLRSQGLPF